MSSVVVAGSKDDVLKLSAYLVREAAGLDDNEKVVLKIGAESVRKMALAAQRERDFLMGLISDRDQAHKKEFDNLRTFKAEAEEIVSRYGVCSMADGDENMCSYKPCPYCELVYLVDGPGGRE